MTNSMITEFYIDESGNTGDLSSVEIGSYFTEQRMFALAAFGIAPDPDFESAILALKARHRVQAPEIKSKEVYNKPRFIIDLMDLLEAQECPIFIELVDKHFFIITNIIERMVIPYVGECDVQPDSLRAKSIMANYMALYAPRELSHSFTECCQTRDHAKIRALYQRIIEWAEWCPISPQEAAHGISIFARDSLRDFEELPTEEAVNRALPIPDKTSAGKLSWVLPNLTSFTNIYARINHLFQKQVSGITLYHDEQIQFDTILLHNKKIVEDLIKLEVKLPLKRADYEFSEAADLKFLRSLDSIGIQVADVLAGFITRYVQDAVWGEKAIHPDKMAVFDRLIDHGEKTLGTGINFVVPDSMMLFLGIEPISNY
jgi:hypothetical protein